ncbi:unnamed protein product [Durusdinium trenchii]|uniref:Uncharacterized protein n=1 Tax=Durusdinium trenchii TaxID=1381693 RepID=A0ABP0SWH4_9DINO
MVAQKRRYLLFEVLGSTRAASEDELMRAFREALEADWGQLLEAQANLRMLYWSPVVHLGILRIPTRVAQQLRASLTLLSKLTGVPVQLRVANCRPIPSFPVLENHHKVHCLSGALPAAQRHGDQLLREWQRSAMQRTSTASDCEAVKQVKPPPSAW